MVVASPRRSGFSARLALLLLLLLSCATPLVAQESARWIWTDAPGERHAFAREVVIPEGEVTRAVLCFSADNHAELIVNGKSMVRLHDWKRARRVDLRGRLRPGKNLIVFRAWNDSGAAGLIAELVIERTGASDLRIGTDHQWRTCAMAKLAGKPWRKSGDSEGDWAQAKEVGVYGASPWGRISWPGEAQFQPREGFVVEEVGSAPGSLIALTNDPRGRLYVSVERGGIHRLEDRDEDGRYETSVPLPHPLKNAQGMCWHDGALWVVAAGPRGTGLHRLSDDGSVETIGLFKAGGGEHGAHAVVPGPDGRLWVTLGNHVRLLEQPAKTSPHRNWYEAPVLPRMEDPRGHARGIRAPAGVVLSVDPKKKDWHIEAGGFRNTYDIAFSAHGELFAYDSDMEWDLGLPWYRPTALYHVVPGGEYGWRTGSGKWPWELPDVLPPAVEVGRGSPTGLVLYDGDAWPASYRGTLLGGDWSCGRIVLFRLRPDGISFKAEVEDLLHGRPLNVTDLVVEGSGQLLFTTGGRGTEGGIFRLRYVGEKTEAKLPSVTKGPSALRLARSLWTRDEILAGSASPDRWLRYLAARKAEDADDPALRGALPKGEERLLHARLVLRNKDRSAAERFLSELARTCSLELDPEAPAEHRLLAIRCIELCLGTGAALPKDFEKPLLSVFPSGSRPVDRRVAQLLSKRPSTAALEALLTAMRRESSGQERIHLASCVSAVETRFSEDQAKILLDTLQKAQEAPGGASHLGFLKAIAKRCEARLPEASQKLFAKWRSEATLRMPKIPSGLPRRDQDRTLLLLGRLKPLPRRSRVHGAEVFRKSCAACHRIGLEGARVGPDLTTVVQRLSDAEMLTAIMDPSRDISDQYRSYDVWTKDGELVTGALVTDADERIVLLKSDGETVDVPKESIEERRVSKTSIMPVGLLDAHTPEEVADLFAFLGAPTIDPTAKAGGFRSLFDGRSLSGLNFDSTCWEAKDGQLIGSPKDDGGCGLVLPEKAGDFLLEFEVLLERGDASFVFRAEASPAHRLEGYRVRMGGELWGSLDDSRKGRMLALSDPTIWGPELRRHGWNHMVVEARGSRLRVEINGITTAVFAAREGSPKGAFGFELSANTRVRLRSLRLRSF